MKHDFFFFFVSVCMIWSCLVQRKILHNIWIGKESNQLISDEKTAIEKIDLKNDIWWTTTSTTTIALFYPTRIHKQKTFDFICLFLFLFSSITIWTSCVKISNSSSLYLSIEIFYFFLQYPIRTSSESFKIAQLPNLRFQLGLADIFDLSQSLVNMWSSPKLDHASHLDQCFAELIVECRQAGTYILFLFLFFFCLLLYLLFLSIILSG